MSSDNTVNRRDFLKTASVTSALTGLAGSAFAPSSSQTGRPYYRRE